MFHRELERRIFAQAIGFHRIAHESIQLKDDKPQDVSYVIAGLVNSAFASELYLKCLLFLDTGMTTKTHDLHKLYKALKPETRDEIERRFDTKRESVSTQGEEEFFEKTGRRLARKFKDVIVLGNLGFIEWRYLYENTNAAMEYGLLPLPDILATLILERKPDWRHGVWALNALVLQPKPQLVKCEF